MRYQLYLKDMQLYTLNHAHCQGWGQSCFKWGCRTHNAPAEVHHFGPWSAAAAHGLPWGDDEDVKAAGPDTAGKPQTEQRQLCKVRWYTACMSAALSIVSPQSDLDSVRDSQVRCATCPLYPVLSRQSSTLCRSRSGTSCLLVWWSFLFFYSAQTFQKNSQAMRYQSYISRLFVDFYIRFTRNSC